MRKFEPAKAQLEVRAPHFQTDRKATRSRRRSQYFGSSVRQYLRQSGLSTVDEVSRAYLEFPGGAGLLRLPNLGAVKPRQIRQWLLLQTGDPRFDGPDAKHAQRHES